MSTAFQPDAFEHDAFQVDAVSGTGAVAFGKPSLAGTGTVTTVAITGTGGVTFDPPSLDGAGAVAGGSVAGHHGGGRLPRGAARVVGPAIPLVRRKPKAITGSGGVTFAVPSFAGTGVYDDDELVIEMLLLEAA